MKQILLLLTVLSHVSFGQHILIKNDGEKIPYKRIKFLDGYVQVVDEDRDKIKVSENDLMGYYDEHYQRIFYKKPMVPNNETRIEIFPTKRDETKFEYLEREEIGRINLYKKEIVSGSPMTVASGGIVSGGTSSTIYYYAEKDGAYKNVFITGLLRDKSEAFNVLRSFVEDDSDVLKKVESEDFRFTQKNLVRLIQEYNLKNFQKVKASDYNSQSNASFYTRVRPKLKEKLKITVNDSLEYQLPASHLPLPIALPNDVASKVCVSWDTGSTCKLISPNPYAVHYYEFNYQAGSKTFDIEKKTLTEFKNYMSSVLKN